MKFDAVRNLGAAALIVVLGVQTAMAQPADPAKKTPQPTTPTTPTPAPQPAKPAPAPTPAPDIKPVVEPMSWVEIKTSMGDIVVELDGAKAPISVANFLTYVNEGYYDGTIFHRVINNFMIQGGGFTPDIKEKTKAHAAIKNEWRNGLKNKNGTIAMARTSAADSATSQFYINVKDNDALDVPRPDAAYAVFGHVVSGMDVVNKIKAVPTGSKAGMQDVPVTTVTIEKVRKLSPDEAAKFKGAPSAPAPAAPDAPKPK